MNKELQSIIELSISNNKHITSQKDYNFNGVTGCSPVDIYLLEKIEDLQTQIDELKVKRKNIK